MPRGMGDSWMRNDSDIFWQREVMQQMALPYRWKQDIRHVEVEFDVLWWVDREHIFNNVDELKIDCGVRGNNGPFIEVRTFLLMSWKEEQEL